MPGRIAVLASGNGSNFEVLATALPDEVALLVCNAPGAACLARAERLGVPSALIPHADYPTRAAHESSVGERLAQLPDLSLIVLAGYMRILTPAFFAWRARSLPQVRIVNLHPAYLDDYKGAHAFAHAVGRRFPRWGLTIHEATPALDDGPVLATASLPLFPHDTPESLAARARPQEHQLLTRTVRALLAGAERPR